MSLFCGSGFIGFILHFGQEWAEKNRSYRSTQAHEEERVRYFLFNGIRKQAPHLEICECRSSDCGVPCEVVGAAPRKRSSIFFPTFSIH